MSPRHRSRPVALLALGAAALSTTVRADPPPSDGGAVQHGADHAPDDVVVAAARPTRSAPVGERGLAGSRVEGARLRRPAITLPDVVRQEPGAQVYQLGGVGAPATLSLRGATSAQTPVTLGGIRINDELAGAADLGTIPTHFTERVEVYRSFAPADTDIQSIGGAVVVMPRRPTGPEVHSAITGGSFGTVGGAASLGTRAGRSEVLVSAQGLSSANDYGFADDQGTLFKSGDDGSSTLQNADVTTGDVWLWARTAVGAPACLGADLSLVANVSEREQGAPKLALVASEAARVRSGRRLVGFSTRTYVGALAQLDLSTEALFTEQRVDDPLRELSLLHEQVELTGQRVAERGVLTLRPAGAVIRVTAEYTLDGLRRDERDPSVSEVVADSLVAHRHTIRAQLDGEWPTHGPVALRGLVAVEHRRTTADAGDPAASQVTVPARIGARARLGGGELYANLGHTQRPPTLGELFGLSYVVRGNPDLVAERAVGGEVGYRGEWPIAAPIGSGRTRPWLGVDLAAHGRGVEELVSYVRAAQGFLVPQNVSSARILGAEVMGSGGLGRWLQARVALSVLDPRDTTADSRYDNDVLPYQSRLVATARLASEVPLPSPVLGPLALWFELEHRSSRYADRAGLEVIPAQTTADTGARLSLLSRPRERGLATELRVSNLFDVARYDVVGFPMPGRAVFVTLEATW